MSEQEPGQRTHLLSPVLDAQAPPQPLFSAGAEFLTAFFGGPFAILILSAMNARILGRLRADLWRYVLGTVAVLGVITFLAWLRVADPPPDWYAGAVDDHGRQAVRLFSRVIALLVWLALWLPYRRYHKAAEVMGVENRPPWMAAVGSIAVGWLTLYLIYIAVTALV